MNRLIKIIMIASAMFLLAALRSDQQKMNSPNLRHLLEAVGQSDTSQFGLDVVGVGDQNRDGFADILVSARGERNTYLFLGGSPMDSLPDMVFRNTLYPAAADVNGDSVKDFLFTHFDGDYTNLYTKLYYGGTHLDTIPDLIFRSTDTADGFGYPYAIGDFNGDGYEDIAISYYGYPNQQYQGKVRVYFGGSPMDNIADWVAHGDSLRYDFGIAVDGGDLNGDGYSDLIIGGDRSVFGSYFSYIKIFFGSMSPDTIPDLIIHGSSAAHIVGDVNGDGYEDLAVYYPRRQSSPPPSNADTSTLIYYGGNPFDTIPDLALKWSSFSGSGPGWVISNAGDINRDGFDDIILGNRRGFGGYGEVLIYLGGRRMSGQFDFGFAGLTNSYEGAGEAVGRAGDVNGDKVDDMMFGAWNNDPGFNNRPGRVEIFGGDTSIVVGIIDPKDTPLPKGFELSQNFPNPFNSSTQIRYTIPSVSSYGLLVHVNLTIYDMQGKEVRRLIDQEERPSGEYIVHWDSKDDAGSDVATGVYLYRLSVKNHSLSKRMLLIH
ncbi:MAG: FG-GAP repeat protein [Ignavibacteria bacterium]|nr:FG-GAP repeat protein [Ignavibacteria bacterium]